MNYIWLWLCSNHPNQDTEYFQQPSSFFCALSWSTFILPATAAAAAAKSIQTCLILCDPIDWSPPGSSVSGILQARIPEWVAISFSNVCMHAKSLQPSPTLCDPIDGSPPGSPVHRILQARTAERVAFPFSSGDSSSSHISKHVLWLKYMYFLPAPFSHSWQRQARDFGLYPWYSFSRKSEAYIKHSAIPTCIHTPLT